MSSSLHRALLDLGDVPAPPDLAGRALARARRDRRRRLPATVLAAVAAVAAAVAVPVTALGRSSPPAAGRRR